MFTPAVVESHPIELSRAECSELLAGATLGRVAYTDQALPQVVPVNYGMDGTTVVFRTSAAGRLARCCAGAVVAFEVDQVDLGNHTGWSVLVVGSASAIDAESDLVRARQLSFAPLSGGVREQFIRITPGIMTGRRLE